MEHPITPPDELVTQWLRERPEGEYAHTHLATQAARWGDDQRLMACCELVKCSGYPVLALQMLAAMGPKPPSLAEQAQKQLNYIRVALADTCNLGVSADMIESALKRLAELEALSDG